MNVKNFLFLVITILLLEVFCQITLIIFGDNKFSILFKPLSNQISKFQTDYLINWDYENNKMKPGSYISNTGVKYKINSKGFRGKEFEFEKSSKRILAFGGSTTIGLESPENKTYPALLEKMLKQNKKEYEVINMGFGSKSINFIKNILLNEAYKYKPDIIIIYSNRNSLMYDGAYVDPNISSSQLLKINYKLQENIMIYRLMFKIYKRIINLQLKSGYLKAPFTSKGINEGYLNSGYVNSLKEIIKFCEKRGIEVFLVKQAYYFNKNIIKELNNYSSAELIKNYKNDFFLKKYNLDEETNFWSVMGTVLNKNLDILKDYKNVKIINPINALITSEKNFTDYLHLTPAGNFILATEISKEIQ